MSQINGLAGLHIRFAAILSGNGWLIDDLRLVLAALVTMTPGTLSVDLLDEADQLVVHGLYDAKDPEALLTTIRNRYQPVVAKLPI